MDIFWSVYMGMRKMREFTKKQTLWPILMGGVQPSQGYRATTWRRFTFKHSVPMSSWYSFDRPRKDERLSWLWIHPGVLSRKPLDWESSALTTRLITFQVFIFLRQILTAATFCYLIYFQSLCKGASVYIFIKKDKDWHI